MRHYYGLRIIVSESSLCPTDTCENAVRVLVGGQFQLSQCTELISAVYVISISKPQLQPVILEIQHCTELVTQEGEEFHTGDQYGTIHLCQFSFKAIVKFIKKLF